MPRACDTKHPEDLDEFPVAMLSDDCSSATATATAYSQSTAAASGATWPSILEKSDWNDEAMPEGSIWNLPGFDKTTFYAAALYLHAAAGQLRAPAVRSMEPQSDERTRNFLDRLADCFAWSKSSSARSHVTATAMVRNETGREITVYIAKNHIDQGPDPGELSSDIRSERGWSQDFADILFGWFNGVACEDVPVAGADTRPPGNEPQPHERVWNALMAFNESRLEYYIAKIRAIRIEDSEREVLEVENNPGWIRALDVMSKCRARVQSQECDGTTRPIPNRDMPSIEDCVLAAHRARQNRDFRMLLEDAQEEEEDDGDGDGDGDVEPTTAESSRWSEDLIQLTKWINYLGRIRAAYTSFIEFCTAHRGYSFRPALLPPLKGRWPGEEYVARIDAWTGSLGLDDELEDGRTVRAVIDRVAQTSHGLGSIHCEMQLLMHFNRPGQPECLDYFGCSKRSCWLCWQVMSRCTRYTTKGTHFAITPRWVLPPLRLDPSKPEIAQGLNSAYEYMLSQIRRKVIDGIDISSQQRKTHSSPRLTLQHLRDQDIPDKVATSLDPFATSVILAPGRKEIAMAAAIHLPAGPRYRDPREVRLGLYERIDDPSDTEYFLDALAFRGKTVVTATQLITRLQTAEGAGLEEFEESLWMHDSFGILEFPNKERTMIWEFTLCYRTLIHGMPANPWILRSLESDKGQVREDLVPWRGDVFILYTPHGTTQPPSEWEVQESLIDKDRALELLRDWVCSDDYDGFLRTIERNTERIKFGMFMAQSLAAEAEADALLRSE